MPKNCLTYYLFIIFFQVAFWFSFCEENANCKNKKNLLILLVFLKAENQRDDHNTQPWLVNALFRYHGQIWIRTYGVTILHLAKKIMLDPRTWISKPDRSSELWTLLSLNKSRLNSKFSKIPGFNWTLWIHSNENPGL